MRVLPDPPRVYSFACVSCRARLIPEISDLQAAPREGSLLLLDCPSCGATARVDEAYLREQLARYAA